MPSLKNLLAIHNNNYNKLSKLFMRRTGMDIIKGNNKTISLNKSCSVIIPFHKNYLFLKRSLISLWYQNLPKNFKKNKVEIIIINDGSPINLKKLIQQTQKFYSVIYLKLKRNEGRAIARNLGLLYAKNEIVIFLDADIVVPKIFLFTHLIRHQFMDKCIIVGFRQNIYFKNFLSKLDKFKQNIVKLPNYKKDFRYKKFIPTNWKNIYKEVPPDNFNKMCYILKESDYFKKFARNKIFGVWELPFMFLACNISVQRKYVIEVGGFDTRFKDWGLEDTHLGLKLIGKGLYLIPNLDATVFHLVKRDFKENRIKKIEEFKRNFKLYTELKNEDLSLFKETSWKKKMRQYFKNKFEYLN